MKKPIVLSVLAVICFSSSLAFAKAHVVGGKVYFRLSCSVIDLQGSKARRFEVSSDMPVQTLNTLILSQAVGDDAWKLNTLTYEYQCEGRSYYGETSLGSASKYPNLDPNVTFEFNKDSDQQCDIGLIVRCKGVR